MATQKLVRHYLSELGLTWDSHVTEKSAKLAIDRRVPLRNGRESKDQEHKYDSSYDARISYVAVASSEIFAKFYGRNRKSRELRDKADQ